MAVVLAPKLAKILCGLIAVGIFPVLWRTDDITHIPKGSSSYQFSLGYRSTSITSIISKVYKKTYSSKAF